MDVSEEASQIIIDLDVTGPETVFVDSVTLTVNGLAAIIFGERAPADPLTLMAALGLTPTEPELTPTEPELTPTEPEPPVDTEPPSVSVRALAMIGCAGPGTLKLTDEDIRASVQLTLALDPVIGPLALTVQAADGVAYVIGRTATAAEQTHALRIACAVPGVVDAVDNMTLFDAARAAIHARVRARLDLDPMLSGVPIKITVDDGVVRLNSTDTTPAQRAHAVEAAAAVEGVVQVIDLMR